MPGTAFAVSKSFRENQLGGGSKFTPPRLGLMSKNLAFGVC